MSATRVSLAELDLRASTAEAPYAIITADCSDPREIDDGLFVQPLDTAQEAYRVGVCVADTSRLHDDSDIRAQVMQSMEARYFDVPGGGHGYEPMIDPEAIRDLEFKQGKVRGAMIVSFLVGKDLPPSEVDVSFGQVEVIKNLDYKTFYNRTMGPDDRRFDRASRLIMDHLRYSSGGDYGSDRAARPRLRREVLDFDGAAWRRGSQMNEALMVASNHLVMKMLAEENRPRIFRVNGSLDFLPPDIAGFSLEPGFHAGLNLDPYGWVTSPLRRGMDWFMNYWLKQRSIGEEATPEDYVEAATVVDISNYRILQNIKGRSQYAAHTDDRRAPVIELHPAQLEATG